MVMFAFRTFETGASGFGIIGCLLEGGGIGSGYATDHIEMDGGDGPSGIKLFHRQGRTGVNALRRKVRRSQLG